MDGGVDWMAYQWAVFSGCRWRGRGAEDTALGERAIPHCRVIVQIPLFHHELKPWGGAREREHERYFGR
jgi:hypothetical protein